jgi:hypothetical protein
MTKMPRPPKQAGARPVKLCLQPQLVPIVLPDTLAPDRPRAIRSIKRKWVNGTVIQYHFLECDQWSWPKAQRDAVRWAFDTWKELKIGLVFEETKDAAEAEIRIGVLQTDGSWSYVGTDCLKYQDLGRTMNFGWNLTTEWGQATALHEIGHALGLPHEHQNPNAGIVWNEELVYQMFSGDPNYWDRDTIRHNIINKLPRNDTEGSRWDPKSIMHYPFEPGLITAPRLMTRVGSGRTSDCRRATRIGCGVFIRREPRPCRSRRCGSNGSTRSPANSATSCSIRSRRATTRCRPWERRTARWWCSKSGTESPGISQPGTTRARRRTRSSRSLVKGRRYIIRVRVHYVMSPDGVALLVF